LTHQGFKDIVSNYYGYSEETINEFLDALIEDPLLESWYKQWQTGSYKKIFDEIELMNEIWYAQRNQREPPNSSFHSPIDFDVSRKSSNNNSKRKN